MHAILLSMLLAPASDLDARAALALAAASGPAEARPAPAKPCPCSPACTCGCNDGLPCRCSAAQAAQPAAFPVLTPPAPRAAPAFFAPAYQPRFFMGAGGFRAGGC